MNEVFDSKGFRKYIGKMMLQLIWFLLFFTIIANLFGLFWIFWWFDMPMHFLGGLFVGFLVLYSIPKHFYMQNNRAFLTFLLVSFVIGLGWEFFEVSMDVLFKSTHTNWLDSLSDLGFDLAGSTFAYLLLLKSYPIRKE